VIQCAVRWCWFADVSRVYIIAIFAGVLQGDCIFFNLLFTPILSISSTLWDIETTVGMVSYPHRQKRAERGPTIYPWGRHHGDLSGCTAIRANKPGAEPFTAGDDWAIVKGTCTESDKSPLLFMK
jgi:hypothetical protein